MNTRLALGSAAALAVALLASAPAAACSSSVAVEVYGTDQDIGAEARDCAEIGIYAPGYDSVVDATVAGPGSRAAIGSLGGGTSTDVDAVGVDNQIGTLARSGGSIAARVRGDGNGMALRARDGGAVSGEIVGSGNQVRAEAR